MTAVQRWVRGTLAGPPTVDVVLTVLLLVAAITSVFAMQPAEGPLGLTLPVAVAMALPLGWRRRYPLAALVMILVASEVQTTMTVSPGGLWAFAVLLLADYSVARHTSESRASMGGALLVCVLWLQERQDGEGDYLFIALVFGGVWLLGRALRRWEQRATAAEQHQDLLARSAVAEERVRIARELHDLVAHSIGVIAVQANAAEAALEQDPDRAREPVRAIKRSAREALEEMRRLLMLLRADEDDRSPEPLPGLSELDGLLASMRQAGLPVQLRVEGRPTQLAPAVDASAYRIIQEALTNVLKHAGQAPTAVTIQYDGAELGLEVSNSLGATLVPAHSRSTPSPGGGHGLVGIRERVGLLGGTLVVGPLEGRYVVRAVLPLEDLP